jgi:hypothetical protein
MSALDYAEFIYYVTGGPVLAAVAIFGLRQIYVAKKSVQINSRRDAYRLSSQQLSLYLTDIIPILNELDRKLDEKNLSGIGGWAEILTGSEGLSIRYRPTESHIASFKDEEVYTLAIKALNHMESFSQPFASGLASESIAYKTVGTTYLNSVKKVLPFMVVAGDEYYKNTMNLFAIWHKRREAERLSKEKDKIGRELDKLGTGTVIVPIGDSNSRRSRRMFWPLK